jgi:cell wall-associated NlpC family hydrolase/uncharacterized protein YukE
LEVNASAVGAATSALSGASDKLTEHADDNKASAAKIKVDWEGDSSDAFHYSTQPVTSALNGASSWASGTASKINDAAGIVTAAHQEVADLIQEFEADAQKLIAVSHSAGSDNPQADAVLKEMAAKYTQSCAQVVQDAKSRLSALNGSNDSTSPSSTSPSSGTPSSGTPSSGTPSSGTPTTGSTSPSSTGDTPTSGTPSSGTPSSGTPSSGTPTTGTGDPSSTNQQPQNGSGKGQATVDAAKKQLGVPYAWGGGDLNGPHKPKPGTEDTDSSGGARAHNDDNVDGFDCAGLVRYSVYQSTGQDVGQGTWNQMSYFQSHNEAISTDASQLQAGDVLYVEGGNHVVIYEGNGQVIEAPESGDVVKEVSLSSQGQIYFAARPQ